MVPAFLIVSFRCLFSFFVSRSSFLCLVHSTHFFPCFFFCLLCPCRSDGFGGGVCFVFSLKVFLLGCCSSGCCVCVGCIRFGSGHHPVWAPFCLCCGHQVGDIWGVLSGFRCFPKYRPCWVQRCFWMVGRSFRRSPGPFPVHCPCFLRLGLVGQGVYCLPF